MKGITHNAMPDQQWKENVVDSCWGFLKNYTLFKTKTSVTEAKEKQR